MDENLTPVEQFAHYGAIASFHFADDTNSSWGFGQIAVKNALQVFATYPEHQPEMREIAKGFLWASDFARMRPENEEVAE